MFDNRLIYFPSSFQALGEGRKGVASFVIIIFVLLWWWWFIAYGFSFLIIYILMYPISMKEKNLSNEVPSPSSIRVSIPIVPIASQPLNTPVPTHSTSPFTVCSPLSSPILTSDLMTRAVSASLMQFIDPILCEFSSSLSLSITPPAPAQTRLLHYTTGSQPIPPPSVVGANILNLSSAASGNTNTKSPPFTFVNSNKSEEMFGEAQQEQKQETHIPPIENDSGLGGIGFFFFFYLFFPF